MKGSKVLDTCEYAACVLIIVRSTVYTYMPVCAYVDASMPTIAPPDSSPYLNDNEFLTNLHAGQVMVDLS